MEISTIHPNLLAQVQVGVQAKIARAASQKEAASQLGISDAHLINFREGNWDKISRNAFNRLLPKLHISSWRTYETENLKLASNILMGAKEEKHMTGLVGKTGLGKTHSLRTFCESMPQAYYVLCDMEMNKRRFLGTIASAVGVRSDEASENSGLLIEAIVAKLITDGDALLVLDDAGKLNDTNLRLVQIIYDRTEGHAGIVLAGTEYLRESLDKKAARNRMGFRELRRRITYWQELREVSMRDVRNICNGNGIEDDGAIQLLHKLCKEFGTLRSMITKVVEAADKSQRAASRDLVASLTQGLRLSN